MKPALQLLAKFHPLIKFVGGPHPIPKNVVATIHPCAPDGLKPSSLQATTASSSLSTAPAFQSRNSMSKRFRYPGLSEVEIEDIDSGGAEILIE